MIAIKYPLSSEASIKITKRECSTFWSLSACTAVRAPKIAYPSSAPPRPYSSVAKVNYVFLKKNKKKIKKK